MSATRAFDGPEDGFDATRSHDRTRDHAPANDGNATVSHPGLPARPESPPG